VPVESLLSREGVTSSSHTPSLFNEESPFQNTEKSGKNKNMVMGSEGARNPEQLCWLVLATIYWTRMVLAELSELL
jgi:hypothetical protein